MPPWAFCWAPGDIWSTSLLLVSLSFLFTFWLTHQTLDSVFVFKRIEEGLKGQSLPSLSLTWGLGARLRKGGARWARTPALSTGSETALRSRLPTNGWLQSPPVFHFHTGALEIHLKRKLRKRNRSEWYVQFSANPIAIESGQTFISPVLRSSWNYHEPKSGEMVADCIRPWPGTMNWFFLIKTLSACPWGFNTSTLSLLIRSKNNNQIVSAGLKTHSFHRKRFLKHGAFFRSRQPVHRRQFLIFCSQRCFSSHLPSSQNRPFQGPLIFFPPNLNKWPHSHLQECKWICKSPTPPGLVSIVFYS